MFVFWSDLATCHYATITRANNINIVPKRNNPPSLPQAYNNSWEVESKEQLRRHICRKVREIDATKENREQRFFVGYLKFVTTE